MFIAILSITAKTWKQLRSVLVGEQINEWWYINNRILFNIIKKLNIKH